MFDSNLGISFRAPIFTGNVKVFRVYIPALSFHSFKWHLIVMFALMGIDAVNGQHTPQIIEASPVGGVEALAELFFQVQLDESDQYVFDATSMRLLFKVNREGIATLEKACNPPCEYSYESVLSAKVPLPTFKPKMIDGEPMPSYYSLWLSPGRHIEGSVVSEADLNRYGVFPKMNDVEHYEMGQPTLLISLGAAGNIFTGNASSHLDPGIGGFVDLRFSRKNNRELVFGLGVFFNRIRNDFDLEVPIEQLRFTENVWVSIGYSFGFGNHRLTPEFGSLLTNIAKGTDDLEGIQESRYGLGFCYTRFIPIFRPMLWFDEEAKIVQSHISLHLRAHYFLNNTDVLGRGALLELGVGYALGTRKIHHVRFKDNFYE